MIMRQSPSLLDDDSVIPLPPSDCRSCMSL